MSLIETYGGKLMGRQAIGAHPGECSGDNHGFGLKRGKVYLVGAGPGDPGLLTLKGRDLLAVADCVIYDYLVSREILDFAGRQAELIYVGKRGTEISWAQCEINRLLVEKAEQYSVVVRLKGGDPFIFGRGGEEAHVLVDAGIEWEVVPGVSAGSAVPAYAGIPVTHRGLSSSVAFVTGHEDPTKPQTSIRWDPLSKGVDTLVFFMGIARIGEISSQLIAHGRSSETPVAVISWGTSSHQTTAISTLEGAAAMVEREQIKSPAIIVVGQVVRFHERLSWFNDLQVQDNEPPINIREALAG